jgi:phospholipid N-methyltransferase
MLDEARIETARVVVEYGPGTGVFTDEIVRRLRPDAHLLVFEVNPQFYADLRARITDPRVHLIHSSAAEIGIHLQQLGLTAPQSIVSGLPFTSLPRPVTHEILQATYHALQPGGVFVTYQYTPLLRKLLQAHFDTTRITRFVLRNLPPALVFVCRKHT